MVEKLEDKQWNKLVDDTGEAYDQILRMKTGDTDSKGNIMDSTYCGTLEISDLITLDKDSD